MTLSIATRSQPFPQNLSAAQRRYIEAVDRNGTIQAAATALGLAFGTVDGHLKRARLRTGDKTTAALVARYRDATQRSPA